MNYIAEINAFYDWLETNSISNSAIALWHALMHINNKAGWVPEFAVAISVLESKTGLKKDAIIRARLRLQQLNRIDFRNRSGQLSAVYRIIPFLNYNDENNTGNNNNYCVVLSDTNCDTNRNANREQTATQTTTQTAAINKLNKTKLNKESKKERSNGSVVKRPQNNYQGIIDSFTDNEKLKDTLWSYIQMRIKKRAAPTDHALELVLKHLQELSCDVDTQITILERSIMNNWTDIYPLKDTGTAKNTAGKVPQRGNFVQRQYTDAEFEKMYYNNTKK